MLIVDHLSTILIDFKMAQTMGKGFSDDRSASGRDVFSAVEDSALLVVDLHTYPV